MILTCAVAWFGLLVLAVLNGVFREKYLAPRMTERTAHQVSTVTCLMLFAGFLWLLFAFRPPPTRASALAVGVAWMALTVAFEFLFGRLALHRSWKEIAADYNLARGRIWLLIPLFLALAPWIAFLLFGSATNAPGN